MLKIENIDVYYGAIHAVKNVSFEVGEGEIVALIGANGAGKSTILKTVSGLMHPRSASVVRRSAVYSAWVCGQISRMASAGESSFRSGATAGCVAVQRTAVVW